MTFAPATIIALGKYWKAQGGVLLGIVGDTAHQAKGRSYHLGKSQLSVTAYSAKTARDKAGLTEAASAIDLGRLDGSLGDLTDFSVWLVNQCQAGAPGTRDIREVIYGKDGVVLRYDREDGVRSEEDTGEADNSHLTHTHVSFYRDSQSRDKVSLFKPFFEDVMPNFSYITDDKGRLITGTLKPKADGGKCLNLKTGKLVTYDPTWVRKAVKARLDDPILAGKPDEDFWTLGFVTALRNATFYLDRNVVFTPEPPVTVSVPDVAGTAKAVAEAVAKEKARVAPFVAHAKEDLNKV